MAAHPGPHDLDDDTLAHIFSCVQLQDILKLAPVCKRWKKVLEDLQVGPQTLAPITLHTWPQNSLPILCLTSFGERVCAQATMLVDCDELSGPARVRNRGNLQQSAANSVTHL